jgi:hypothetical protein
MGGQNLTSKHVIQNGLAKGETQYGTFMMLNSGWTARLVAAVGWDVGDARLSVARTPAHSSSSSLTASTATSATTTCTSRSRAWLPPGRRPSSGFGMPTLG